MKAARRSRRAWILKPLLAGLSGVAVALVLECPSAAPCAQPSNSRAVKVTAPDQEAPSNACPQSVEQLLTLSDARQMASVRQPAVVAAQSSLAAAQARYNSIKNLRGLAVFERDYRIRKEQSCIGLEAAEAGLLQAEADAVYSATRLYLTVIYARTQLPLAA